MWLLVTQKIVNNVIVDGKNLRQVQAFKERSCSNKISKIIKKGKLDRSDNEQEILEVTKFSTKTRQAPGKIQVQEYKATNCCFKYWS